MLSLIRFAVGVVGIVSILTFLAGPEKAPPELHQVLFGQTALAQPAGR